MKKKSFTNKLSLAENSSGLRAILGFLLCFWAIGFHDLQAQCPLACNNLVQVSLEGNCEVTVTPAMMLQDMGPTPPCNYTVVVFGPNNLPLPTPVVTGAHIGKKLRVSVRLENGNSCWGEILVEDKLPPEVDCPDDITVFCNRTNYLLPAIAVKDNCSGLNVTQHILEDKMEMYNCALTPADPIIGRRVIRFYYTDASGNRSDTCEQHVYFRKFSFVDIQWPRDTAFSCEDYDTIPLPKVSGVPTVDGESIFPSWGACKIAVTFEDQLIPVCPKSFKVIRKWTVLDWCTPGAQGIYVHNQLIKVVDDRGPVITCPGILTVSTDVWSCTGSAVIPPPTIISECSKVTFDVGYKVLSAGGAPTFEGTSKANITKLPNGYYAISGLPLGLSWVIFRATDECGNFTDCSTEVLVEDKVPPVPVCDQKTVVSLTLDGTAKIEAFTFDDRSHDNCGIDFYEVRRMDQGVPCKDSARSSQWGPFVYFCCEDIGKTIMVSLRVWDKAGNNNVCMVEVDVQDKTAPFVFCPPNITVSCAFDFLNYDVFGTVQKNIADRKNIVINDPHVSFSGTAIDGYAFDGCGFNLVEKVNRLGICGQDTIYRTFEATDKGGLTGSCTQRIVIRDFNPDNIRIQWPVDYLTNTVCINKENVSPDITGRPVVNGKDKCSSILVNYKDEPFVSDPDACIKIIRTWEVIDWCVYRPNDQNTKGYWSWKQIIKIINRVAPTITSDCRNRTVDVFGPGCQGPLELIAYATDDCTDSTKLTWYHEIDLYNDGRPDASHSGTGKDASGNYPIGVHKVTFRVWDACDNHSFCTYLLTVRDGKKPTPYCHSGITTTVMPSTKSIAVWAKDFNLNSEDNCTPKDSLKYFFKVDTSFHSSMIFDCSNIGRNIVRMYVFDQAGNYDYCEAIIEIQDPNKVCPNGLTIQGKLTTPDDRPLNNTEVLLERANPAGSNIAYTNANGIFSFTTIASNINYTVKPSRNFDFINGVTGQDIVMLQRHILGQQYLNTPYQLIAADVNNNQQITASDISEIRKLILGITSRFNNNQSWRFVPTRFRFADPNRPFPFDEVINFNPIKGNEMSTDFVAIKIGDLSGNADVNLNGSTSRTNPGSISLVMPDVKYRSGETLILPVSLGEETTISGMQLGMEFLDSGLKLQSIRSGSIELKPEEYVIAEDRIRIVKALDEDKNLKTGEILFTLVFEPQAEGSTNSKIMVANPDEFRSEVYDEVVDAKNVELVFRSQDQSGKGFKMYQNTPNPFNNETQISFEIESARTVEFLIHDLDGKAIRRIEKHYPKGQHNLTIRGAELPATGVYFIRMVSGEGSETRKMVYIK